MYITDHPVLKKDDRKVIQFYFNNEPLNAKAGQTIAAALMGNGIKKVGVSRKLQKSRGLFCARGRCYSCFVTVDGLDHVLSCSTIVEEGMEVYSNLSDSDVRRGENEH
ncbi:(2Fe-2S)-binding protein [Lentibacillus amyloliquefaciens]|uniref:Sarcosine oxidase subunit alpha n=1 Tax=Lentibacillus amyloliquefaciens TaxID=1472767 RepID=A0A0U3NLW9_9BACI|nr:(2Fe-2S)-binding protein [Lentibacillus amyloliquefaciens]ALX47803.1 sarcosine oxidase subunit alpha [Lentibacillus amyloliquefaciens]